MSDARRKIIDYCELENITNPMGAIRVPYDLVEELLAELAVEQGLRYKTQNETSKRIYELEARLASARAIMEKFVGKVDRGMAKSVETYAEMTEWLEE